MSMLYAHYCSIFVRRWYGSVCMLISSFLGSMELEQSDELSDGELANSSDSSPSHMSGSGEQVATNDELGKELLPSFLPPSKKKKTGGYSEPALYEKSLISTSQGGIQGLTGRQRKRKQKQELRVLENQKRYHMSIAKTVKAEEAQLTSQQMNILQGLIELSRRETLAKRILKLKTFSFRELISHLVVGVPAASKLLKEGLELRNNRVVVSWLSLVSEEFFSNSDSHFSKLKSLSPAQTFLIEHPGSSKFVKLGLESFLCSSSDGELVKPSSRSPISPVINLLTRLSYVLTKEQLLDHGFPVPNSSQIRSSFLPIGDVSAYVKVTDWPEEETQMALPNGIDVVPMFSIDCEMVETMIGSELARVSIVDEAMTCIYDTLVKPKNPVTDYRTKFSGIDEESLKDVSVTLHDVQNRICQLLPSKCILLGHSLDNDFHALHFVHPFVIDTSFLFTPGATPTSKPSLRRLAKELLCFEIQAGSNGHNSIEDAVACMKLVQHKILFGPNCTIPFNQLKPSIITEFRSNGKSTGIVDKPGVVRLFGRGASCSCEVENDTKCVEEALKVIPQCDFTFVQFHDMENFLKSSSASEKNMQEEVASMLDSNIIKLVDGCPKGTLVFVVCGSSDIRLVKKLQQDDFTDMAKLKRVVLAARTGVVTAVIVN